MPFDTLDSQFAFGRDALQDVFVDLGVGLHPGHYAVFAFRRDAWRVESGVAVARRRPQRIAHAGQDTDDDGRAEAADQQPAVDAAQEIRSGDGAVPQVRGRRIAQETGAGALRIRNVARKS